jgi:hypothetical protein
MLCEYLQHCTAQGHCVKKIMGLMVNMVVVVVVVSLKNRKCAADVEDAKINH